MGSTSSASSVAVAAACPFVVEAAVIDVEGSVDNRLKVVVLAGEAVLEVSAKVPESGSADTAGDDTR